MEAEQNMSSGIVGFRDNSLKPMYIVAKSYRYINLAIGAMFSSLLLYLFGSLWLYFSEATLSPLTAQILVVSLVISSLVCTIVACVHGCIVTYQLGAPLIVAILLGGMFIFPLAGVLPLLVTTSIASSRLKRNNVPVGFIGISKKTMQTFERTLNK